MNAPLKIARLDASQADFSQHLDTLLAWEGVSDKGVNDRVEEIIAAVRERGDDALIEYTARFDGLNANSMADLTLDRARLELALERITAEQRSALELAAERVRVYHEHQVQPSWRYTEPDGTILGQQITPLDRAGLYVPGGKASYPSSVLMNAIPAKVAGVPEVVMVVPTPRGEINELVLAAACLAGVDRVFTRRPGGSGAGLRYPDRAAGRQDRRARQYLCGHGQAFGIRAGGHRHDRRTVRDPGGMRWSDRPGLDSHGPVFPGRAR